MISVYNLKPAFQRLLRPCVNFLAKHNITANEVTIWAFILSCLTSAGLLYAAKNYHYLYFILPVFLFIRMALNAFDGMLAREHNQQSRLGAILNEVGDILSDLALYIPFLYIRSVNYWLILCFSLLAMFTETAGIMALQIGSARRYDGPMGKSDRAFWFGLLGLLSAFNFPSSDILNYAVILINIFMLITVFNRFKNALEVKDAAKQKI